MKLLDSHFLVCKFLDNFANDHGVKSPGARSYRGRYWKGREKTSVTPCLILLPSTLLHKDVHAAYVVSCEETGKRAMLCAPFRNVWKRHRPYIRIMTAGTDFCDYCARYGNDLQFAKSMAVHCNEYRAARKFLKDSIAETKQSVETVREI